MFFKKKYESISMAEAKKLKNAAIIDVRTKAEFDTGSMPGAKNIEMNDVVSDTEMFLDKDKT